MTKTYQHPVFGRCCVECEMSEHGEDEFDQHAPIDCVAQLQARMQRAQAQLESILTDAEAGRFTLITEVAPGLQRALIHLRPSRHNPKSQKGT